MNNLVAIIAGEPNSINSEIIAKALRKKRDKNILIIGNYSIFKKQIINLGFNLPVVKINKIEDVKGKYKIFILDVPLRFKSMFNVDPAEVKSYIFKCFALAHNLSIKKKIKGFINAPIDKKIFSNKYLGVTEYLSEKNKCGNKEVMLIHNKELSVVPLTTHIEIKQVSSKINFNLIKKKYVL